MTENMLSQKGQASAASSGITHLSVAGYKSLREACAVEIRPLTLLAGANSSGKSSLMQPLLLLKQTLEASYDPGVLLLNGPDVRFTSADQLLSRKGKDDQVKKFEVEITAAGNEMLALQFHRRGEGGFEISEMRYAQNGRTHRYHYKLTPEEIESLVTSGNEEVARVLRDVYPSAKWCVIRNRCFLGVSVESNTAQRFSFPGSWPGPGERFDPLIRGLIHVPGLRGNPERIYPITAIGSTFPGTFENYTASAIAHWQISDKTTLEALNDDLKQLGLTWKVSARALDDTQIELQVGRLPKASQGGAWDLVNIADVGFGLSQTLPVVVALRVAKPGQLVYLEQPEIHLHPRAQVAMAKLLANAAERGVRVVAETHSALLVLAVQSLVAENSLSPEFVKLHWFKRRSDGATEISSADLDDAGAFGDWPEDFADVTLHAENRYLSAVENNRR